MSSFACEVHSQRVYYITIQREICQVFFRNFFQKNKKLMEEEKEISGKPVENKGDSG